MSQDYSIRQVGGVLATNDANYRKEHFKNALKGGLLTGVFGAALGVGTAAVLDNTKASAKAVSIFDRGVKFTQKVLNKVVKNGTGQGFLNKLIKVSPKYKVFALAVGLASIVGSYISEKVSYNQGKIDGFGKIVF